MEQRIESGGVLEVPDMSPEVEIRDETIRAREALSRSREVPGQEDCRADDCCHDRHRQKGRQDSSDSALVERWQREGAVAQFARDDSADQEPGDDEEDVYADESASELVHPRMREDRRDDGDGTQSVDVRAVRRTARR